MVLKGKVERQGGDEKESLARKEETEKEPEVDKDQDLEFDLEAKGARGEIIERREKFI